MKSRYFFKRLFLFLSFAIASYIFLLIVFSHNLFKNKIPNLFNFSSTSEIREFSELHSSTKRDIVFIGSSHAEFDAPFFSKDSINALNITISSLRPINTYYLLKGEVSNISSKVIALETYYNLINEEPLNKEALLQIISNEHMSWNFAQMILNSKDFVVINSGIGICFYHIFHPLNVMEPDTPGLAPNEPKTAENVPTLVSLEEELRNMKSYSAVFSSKALDYLQKSIDLIKTNGKKAILIMAPVTVAEKNNCLNYTTICHSLDSLAKRNDILFLNYNDPDKFVHIGLSNNDFYDNNHLTVEGRGKFSKAVSADLKKINIF